MASTASRASTCSLRHATSSINITGFTTRWALDLKINCNLIQRIRNVLVSFAAQALLHLACFKPRLSATTRLITEGPAGNRRMGDLGPRPEQCLGKGLRDNLQINDITVDHRMPR